MKTSFHFTIGFLIFASVTASASTSFFVGPSLGATSQSSADGGAVRDSHFSLGGEANMIIDHWAAGLVYKYFAPPEDGSAAVNVNQTDNWLSAEAKYRFWNLNFSPYASAGLGAMIQTVTTQVMGASDKISGTFLVRDLGLGVMGHVTNQLGVNFAARYFQYSNVNGFDYVLTLGFFPD